MLLSLAAVDPNPPFKGLQQGEGVKQLGAVAHHPNKNHHFPYELKTLVPLCRLANRDSENWLKRKNPI